MRALFVCVAAGTLLAGCEQPAEQNESIVSSNSPAVVEPSAERTNAVFDPPADAELAKALMNDRHEGMEDIGDAFKAVNAQLKGSAPDMTALQRDAATIATLATKSAVWFPPGTGPDVGKTRAKAEIWQKPDDFAAKDKAFHEAAIAFKAAADLGDVNAVKAAAGELGKNCKACHDPYRAPEKD